MQQIRIKTNQSLNFKVNPEDNIFPDDFITKCKQCPNVPHTISNDVENNIKRMAMNKVYMHRLSSFGERT